MDFKLIDTLSSLDPRLPTQPSVRVASRGLPMDIQARASARFVPRYVNPAFGWDIATAFADARKPFPTPVIGRDHWLLRAYMLRLDSVRWYCPTVVDAWSIANLPEARSLKSKLCSLLIAGCGRDPYIHRREVARAFNIDVSVIEAFDILFYNVLDRASDEGFLSELVYPSSRVVEMSEDYMRQTDVADLLLRAGYNHRDLQMSAFLAGVGDQSYLAKLASRDDREQELTRQLMGNALLLVNAGAMNQRSVGLSRAGTLLASSRQAGVVAEVSPVAESANYLGDALRAAVGLHDQQRLRLVREDAGAA